MAQNVAEGAVSLAEKRAAIPRPSICRAVVIARKDGYPGEAWDGIREAPATVIVVDDEGALRIRAFVGGAVVSAVHRDLVPEDAPGTTFVWYWPPRTS